MGRMLSLCSPQGKCSGPALATTLALELSLLLGFGQGNAATLRQAHLPHWVLPGQRPHWHPIPSDQELEETDAAAHEGRHQKFEAPLSHHQPQIPDLLDSHRR
eukprot:8023044-Karenia_brevis.AAC.1